MLLAACAQREKQPEGEEGRERREKSKIVVKGRKTIIPGRLLIIKLWVRTIGIQGKSSNATLPPHFLNQLLTFESDL